VAACLDVGVSSGAGDLMPLRLWQLQREGRPDQAPGREMLRFGAQHRRLGRSTRGPATCSCKPLQETCLGDPPARMTSGAV
jgi:hypothetical protein